MAAGPAEDDVLVLRALGLGDALVSVPALRGLRRAWPGRRLVLAGPPSVGPWLAGLGLVDAVVPARGLAPLPPHARGDGRHVAVNLHGRGPESHRALLATRPARLVAFGAPGLHEGPPWDPEEHEVDRWCRLVRSAGGSCDRGDLLLAPRVARGDHVVVHPGAAGADRRWPVSRFAVVVGALARAGRTVVVTGSPGERARCARVVRGAGPGAAGRVVDRSGALDVGALADVVGSAALLVSGDTGVAHLATAFRTPSVTLFARTPPRLWGPCVDLERHRVLWHGADEGDGARPRAEGAPGPDPLLLEITAEEALAAAAGLLERPPRWRSR
ncbi:glycosyltransferase family 9 protein [Luteimicrobium sp. NPDC057192]|uniref:glycosyltransferase family 9 protein n=1 Tax=Luteimicrobium sp. NPDC057192 TaxID=3346042 RepID=UPI00363033E2